MKKPLLKGKGTQKLSWQTRNTLKKLKMFWKKHKTLKAIWAVLGHLKPKKFICRPTMVTNIFSKILPTPTSCYSPEASRSNYDSSSSSGSLLFYSFAGNPFWSCCSYYCNCFSIFLSTVSYVALFSFSLFHHQFSWQKILDLQDLHHQMSDSSVLRMLPMEQHTGWVDKPNFLLPILVHIPPH